jgi:hypothetical protein
MGTKPDETGPVTQILKAAGGKGVNTKLMLMVLGAAIGGPILSFFGLQAVTPAPEDVKSLNESVGKVEKTLVSIDAKLTMLGDGAVRDKAETQREINTLRREIEKIEAKLLGDHEARIRALEAKAK